MGTKSLTLEMGSREKCNELV